ncbi:MAG: hypothetical protein DWQ05_07235 [Calditrichaeota bacterium]|nr:MAG: hypothetical protein DWQ05_07235 [Calditrichota bacterium]
MTAHPNKIYQEFLQKLTRKNIQYAILRDDITSKAGLREVDLLVNPAQIKLLAQTAGTAGFFMIKDGYLNPGKKVFLRYESGVSYLLDIHELMVYRGLEFMDSTQALRNRVRHNGFYYLKKEDFVLGLLFHNILAKKEIQPIHHVILERSLEEYLDRNYIERAAGRFGMLEVFDQVASQIAAACENPPIIGTLRMLALARLKRRPANIFRVFRTRFRYLGTYFFGRKRGIVIAFIGPDGVGKSTVIEYVRDILRQNGLSTQVAYLGPWGSSLLKLKKIFSWLNAIPYRADYKEFYAGKRQEKPGKLTGFEKWKFFIRSFIYYLFLILEMWARWWLRVLPALRQGKIVLADRYIYDILTGYKNRPMDYHVAIRAYICKNYPRPEIGILLDAEPDIIFSRKPQLSRAQLQHSRGLYHEIATENNFPILDTSQSAEQTRSQFKDKFMPIIIDILQRRTLNL